MLVSVDAQGMKVLDVRLCICVFSLLVPHLTVHCPLSVHPDSLLLSSA